MNNSSDFKSSVYLTENPQITFFKKMYRRHTNFMINNIQSDIVTNDGVRVKFKIPRDDLYNL